jgi:hypothetical protein
MKINKINFLVATVVIGLLSLGSVSAASAAGKVAVDLPNEAVRGGSSAAVPITISDFTDSDLTVRIVASSGSFTISEPGALVLNSGYTAFTGVPEISFHGTTADVTAALASRVSWTAPGDAESSSLLSMRVEVGKFVSGTTYDPLSGHTYVFVESPLAWRDALLAARGMTYQGLTGYLATITSAEENDFVGTKTGAEDIWIGATDDMNFVNEARAAAGKTPINFDSQLTGDYYWAAGPEIGIQFGIGLINPQPVDGGFMNWNVREPNNYYSSEGCGTTNEGGQLGIWNDLDCTGEHPYLVEFSTNLEIFNTSVFTFDNITGESKDSTPAVQEPTVPEVTTDLADTGFDAWLLVVIAAILVAAGAGARVVARRK